MPHRSAQTVAALSHTAVGQTASRGNPYPGTPRPRRPSRENTKNASRPPLAPIHLPHYPYQRETKPKGWSNYRCPDGILTISNFQHFEPEGHGAPAGGMRHGASMLVSCKQGSDVFVCLGFGTIDVSAQLGTRNSSQAVRGMRPHFPDSPGGPDGSWPPGPILNVPACVSRQGQQRTAF
jgi:hypothetical protein